MKLLLTMVALGMLGILSATPLGAQSPTGLLASLTLPVTTYIVSASAAPQHMQATFRLSNPTNQDIRYQQGGLGVDWYILDFSGKTLYDANRGKMIPMFIAIRILKAGAHVDFPGNVPLTTQDGTPLAPGAYKLVAEFRGEPVLESSAKFTVKAG